jgi:tRNA/rRNA methyltransferase
MQIHFILVEPAVPENVGAAARAIKTMGFSSLRLVNTKAHLEEEAKWLAHASDEI